MSSLVRCVGLTSREGFLQFGLIDSLQCSPLHEKPGRKELGACSGPLVYFACVEPVPILYLLWVRCYLCALINAINIDFTQLMLRANALEMRLIFELIDLG